MKVAAEIEVDNRKNKRHIGSISIDTKTIVGALKDIPVGGFVEYGTLSSAIGRNVQGIARGVLESARRICEREYSIVFGVVFSKGLKHLTDEETAKLARPWFDHVRRGSRRTARRIASIKDGASISQEAMREQFTGLSLMGALMHMTTGRQIARLEGKVEEAARELPLQKTLDAFRE